MKNCKRPLMNQKRNFYETPTDASEEEIQRGCKFVKRLKTMDHERIFDPYVHLIKSYQSGSLNYSDLQNRIFYILGIHKGLVNEFHKLLTEKKTQSSKSDLDEGLYDVQKIRSEWRRVSPSYYLRPEASSDEILNDKCVAVGMFNPDKVVKKKRLPLQYVRMNNLEEELFEEDQFLEALSTVIKFGNDVLCEKPPVRFDEVIQRYYGSKKMPPIFKIAPKLAVQDILPRLESMEKAMREEKANRKRKNNSRVPRKNIVNK